MESCSTSLTRRVTILAFCLVRLKKSQPQRVAKTGSHFATSQPLAAEFSHTRTSSAVCRTGLLSQARGRTGLFSQARGRTGLLSQARGRTGLLSQARDKAPVLTWLPRSKKDETSNSFRLCEFSSESQSLIDMIAFSLLRR